MSVAAVVLAAGESRRMGAPKQLLVWGGQSLVVRAVQAVQDAGCTPVVVVLGAYADRVRPLLAEQPVVVVENPEWATGMGSSVRAGVAAVQTHAPAAEALLLTLVDQPLVNATALQRLLQAPPSPIIAAAYEDTVGVPALFARSRWPELLSLNGAAGAKQVLQRHASEITSVDLPEAAWDVDTPESFTALPATGQQ